MSLVSNGRDIYVRHTGADGKSYVECHRVWDAERFLAERQKEAKREGGQAAVQQISQAEYRAAKGWK